MARKETRVQRIVRLTAKRYPYFGQFARKGGVDMEGLVRFVLATRNAIESARRKKADPGNDARDISMTSGLLKPLSSKALEEIAHLKDIEIRKRLKGRFESIKKTIRSGDPVYPFSFLNKKNAEILYNLPISWIREGADWQLNERRKSQPNNG